MHDKNLGTRKNRPRSRRGHKYSKCLSIMMLIFIKQQLSNI